MSRLWATRPRALRLGRRAGQTPPYLLFTTCRNPCHIPAFPITIRQDTWDRHLQGLTRYRRARPTHGECGTPDIEARRHHRPSLPLRWATQIGVHLLLWTGPCLHLISATGSHFLRSTTKIRLERRVHFSLRVVSRAGGCDPSTVLRRVFPLFPCIYYQFECKEYSSFLAVVCSWRI